MTTLASILLAFAFVVAASMGGWIEAFVAIRFATSRTERIVVHGVPVLGVARAWLALSAGLWIGGRFGLLLAAMGAGAYGFHCGTGLACNLLRGLADRQRRRIKDQADRDHAMFRRAQGLGPCREHDESLS